MFLLVIHGIPFLSFLILTVESLKKKKKKIHSPWIVKKKI